MADNRPPWFCPCGHPWAAHDIHTPDDPRELCCVDGCDQNGCPGKAAGPYIDTTAQLTCPFCDQDIDVRMWGDGRYPNGEIRLHMDLVDAEEHITKCAEQQPPEDGVDLAHDTRTGQKGQ